MSAVANKTMLVPVAQGTDSMTNFKQEESYNNFKNTAISRPTNRNTNHEHTYDGTGNPILSYASGIFKCIDNLQNSYDIGSLEDTRADLIREMDYFTEVTGKKGIENSQVMLARYILSTFSDELISTTYWGKENNWANYSLLGHFYNETYGGEKFFQILDQLLRAPAKYIHLLELLYVCLSLGFEGRYRIQNRGKMELDSIRESLYKQLKMMQAREPQNFYSSQKVSPARNHLIYKTSYQILALGIFLMLSLVYGLLTFSLAGKENKSMELFKSKYEKYAQAHVSRPVQAEKQVVTIKDINE